MIKINIGIPNTGIPHHPLTEGETIETKINRIVYNKEPIEDGAPIIYMDRKDGILPQYDIRTDRWELAIDAMETSTKSILAKREEKIAESKPTHDTEPDNKPAA